jgi:hypothetical protein
MISLLFLINDDIYHYSVLEKDYFQYCNIFIHPKLDAKKHLQKYVIQERVQTEWGKYSIVQASINLLQNAFDDTQDEWFILLSYDSFPIFSYNELYVWLQTQYKSIFFLNETRNETLWKTSQWWALNRNDVEIILKNYKNYNLKNNYFKTLKMSAVDEIYFLSLLKYVDPDYEYNNYKFMYDKWIPDTIQKHPAYFNRLLKSDILDIKLQNSFFIRKTSPVFERKMIETKKTLLFIYIGTETKQQYSNVLLEYDIIILSAIPIDQILPLLKNMAIQIHSIIYRFYNETIKSIVQYFPLHLWKSVGFTDEKFNISKINKYKIENELVPLTTNTQLLFYPMNDNNGNKTYWIVSPQKQPMKIAFLYLTRNNVNFPEIWKQYFIGNEDKVNLYIHPKETQNIGWLKENVIQNRVHTEWGFITEAYFSLLREAMKNPENMKFVVISESCLPLKSFSTFYDFLLKDDIRTSYIKFLPISRYDFTERIQTQNEYQKYGKFVKHYARFCLSRYHVEKLFFQSLPSDLIFFNRMHVGDEFFLTLLHPKPNVDFIRDFEITYDNWEKVNEQKNIINAEIKDLYELIEQSPDNGREEYTQCIEDIKQIKNKLISNPYSYVKVTQQIVEDALKKESFFWRKFPENSNVVKYFYKVTSGAISRVRKVKENKKTRKNIVKKI